MRALTIRQPWAWLIVAGHKDIENRTWGASYRGPVLIHAGSSPAPASHWQLAADTCRRLGIQLPHRDSLDRGGIVGVATLADVVTESDSPWWIGPIGLVLTDAAPLPLIAMPGRLNLWHPSPELVSLIH